MIKEFMSYGLTIGKANISRFDSKNSFVRINDFLSVQVKVTFFKLVLIASTALHPAMDTIVQKLEA